MSEAALNRQLILEMCPEALHQLTAAVDRLERLCEIPDTDNGHIAEAYEHIAELLVSALALRCDGVRSLILDFCPGS